MCVPVCVERGGEGCWFKFPENVMSDVSIWGQYSSALDGLQEVGWCEMNAGNADASKTKL